MTVSPVPLLTESKDWLQGIEIPSRIAVAWSGGADSTALLLALKGAGSDVEAWHVDHGWHQASNEHAKALRVKASEWKIPFISAQLKAPAFSNREGRARQERYAMFSKWSEERDLRVLCLGHHLDDQVETVCLRLLQGAGVMGCRGMRRQHKIGELQLLRPLLHVSRASIIDALTAVGVAWFEDPSNSDLSLRRNLIRHRFFPAMRRAGFEPVDLLMRWQRQAVRLSDVLMEQLQDIEYSQSGTSISTDWFGWRNQSPPLRAMMLQEMASRLLGQGTVLGRRHIRLTEKWLCDGASGGVDLTRTRLWRDRQGLHLELAAAKVR